MDVCLGNLEIFAGLDLETDRQILDEDGVRATA